MSLLSVPFTKNTKKDTKTWKQQVTDFFDHPSTPWAKAVEFLVILMILISGADFFTELLRPAFYAQHQEFFYRLEVGVVMIFTTEYVLRFAAAQRKWRFVFNFYNLIDLIAIIPFYLSIVQFSFIRSVRLLRVLRLARVLRLLKLTKYIPEATRKVLTETSIKNLSVVLLLIPAYWVIQGEFSTLTDRNTIQTLILFVGLVLVAPLFAVFQFPYEYATSKKKTEVFIFHFTTFLGILIVGLIMSMIDILFVMMVGDLFSFRFTLFLFYICMICYDFWGYYRQAVYGAKAKSLETEEA